MIINYNFYRYITIFNKFVTKSYQKIQIKITI